MSKLSNTWTTNLQALTILVVCVLILGGSIASAAWYFSVMPFKPEILVLHLVVAMVAVAFIVICMMSLISALWPEEWKQE